jgi:hypothetical protein
MRWMKWIGVASALLLMATCFMPWVIIPSKNITISGVDAAGINLGKPAYFHFITVFFFLLFTFIPRVWAKRSNLFVTALNLGWAVRNYFIVSTCSGGECPEKQIAIFLLAAASALMLASALFPDIKLKDKDLSKFFS